MSQIKSRRGITIIGEKFSEFTVIEEAERVNGKKQYSCLCSCGNHRVVDAYKLKKGITKSCGCKRTAYIAEARTIHNGRHTILYSKWCGIKRRCLNKNDSHYKNYGARGITICSEWKDDFTAFQQWAINNGYNESLTIERSDPNKGYCPENCKWVPIKEQASNKMNNAMIIYNGERLSLPNLARKLNINIKTLSSRYYRFLRRNPAVNKFEIEHNMLIPR